MCLDWGTPCIWTTSTRWVCSSSQGELMLCSACMSRCITHPHSISVHSTLSCHAGMHVCLHLVWCARPCLPHLPCALIVLLAPPPFLPLTHCLCRLQCHWMHPWQGCLLRGSFQWGLGIRMWRGVSVAALKPTSESGRQVYWSSSWELPPTTSLKAAACRLQLKVLPHR